MKTGTAKRRFQKIVLALTFFISVSLCGSPENAKAWGVGLDALINQTLDNIWDQTQGFILGSLKLQAIQLMNNSIEQLIGGVNGSGLLFISDWKQYLYQVPAEENRLFMNDFFSQTTRGKCSSLNFESISRSTLGSNYFTNLCFQAQSSLYEGVRVVNIDEYSSDPARSLRDGNWRTFNALFANPANNPLGYSLIAQQARDADMQRRIAAQTAEGIANQGYNSVKVGGLTVTPGGTVKALVDSVKTLGNQLTITANSPGEFASAAVAAVANRAIQAMLQKGFDTARTAIQRQVGQLNSQIRQTSQQVNQTLGPGAQFLQGVNQQLGSVNSGVNRTGGRPSCLGNAYAGC